MDCWNGGNVTRTNTDEVMDVACGEYGDLLPVLVYTVENGRLVFQEISGSTLAIPSPALSNNQSWLNVYIHIFNKF